MGRIEDRVLNYLALLSLFFFTAFVIVVAIVALVGWMKSGSALK